MRARPNRTPVLAHGDGGGVDAVHDALVVRRGAVGVGLERARALDPVGDLVAAEPLPGESGRRDAASRAHEAAVRQVREDAQVDAPL